MTKYKLALLTVSVAVFCSLLGSSSWASAKQFGHLKYIGKGQLVDPRAMDVAPSGNTYVADGTKIKVFGRDGRLIQTYDENTPAFDRQMYVPETIGELAVDENESIYFSGLTGPMYKYVPSADLLTSYQGNNWFELFANASDFAAANGSIYISHDTDSKIHKLDTNLNYLLSWGRQGTEQAGELWQPKGITLDRAGNVYVLNTWQHPRHQIQKFNPQGRYIRSWSNAGWRNYVDHANSITVDPKRNNKKSSIYLSDSSTDLLYKINAKNRLLAVWGGRGSKRGKLNDPVDIEMVSGGCQLYVLEAGNKRIQVFKRLVKGCSRR